MCCYVRKIAYRGHTVRAKVSVVLRRTSGAASEPIKGECRYRHNFGLRGFLRVNREIVRPLAAWNLDDCFTWVLDPGAILSGCRILRNHAPGAEPYVVEFDFAGHRYSCPLFIFQPRTQALAAAAERKSVEHAVAV